MSGPRDKDEEKSAYEEAEDWAYSGDDDLDEIAGSAHEGDEYAYAIQEFADDG